MSIGSVVATVLNNETYSNTPGNRKGIVCASGYITVAGADDHVEAVGTLLNDASPKEFDDLYFHTAPVVCRLDKFSIDINVDAVTTQHPTVSIGLAVISSNSGDGYTLVKYLTRDVYCMIGGGNASEDLDVENVPQFVLHPGQNLAVIVVGGLPEAAGEDAIVVSFSCNGGVFYTSQ